MIRGEILDYTNYKPYTYDIRRVVDKLLALLDITNILLQQQTKKQTIQQLTLISPRIAKMIEKTPLREWEGTLNEAVNTLITVKENAERIANELRETLEKSDEVEKFIPLFEYYKWSDYYKTYYTVECGLHILATKQPLLKYLRKNSKKCKLDRYEYNTYYMLSCRT